MSAGLKKSSSNGCEKSLTCEEQLAKEEVAHEAETGKIYRSNYIDKHGRTVLVMRPGCQNSKSTKGQIRYLVYCMENAILNLPSDQEQMVWLIDFNGFNMSHISVKLTRETAHVLQDHYPERLGMAILYNAPKFFEPFWTVVKPFLEPRTRNKVKFVYSDDLNTKKIMEDLFDIEKLESAFGGNDDSGFNIVKYAERMREDDKRIPEFWKRVNPQSASPPPQPVPTSPIDLNSINLSSDSDASDNGKVGSSPNHVSDSEGLPPNKRVLVTEGGENSSREIH
ncbi:random slug protein 5-like isoform X2 [Durio zibethinus]|uniref:Random slug protein 5-like isoform X2 n=1 Tax=Durio zibethinus TaxID=66656 RepID=A0A6P6AU43_DURZI|nr:random slug protein 5-like isoform X2 [Durio zibethinus]